MARPGSERAGLAGAGARLAVLGAALATAAPGAAAAIEERVETFSGIARSPEGALLYREEHEVRRRAGRLLDATTTYRDPEGRLLATLRTDFSRDPFAPAYEFTDARTGAVEGVRPGPGAVELRSPKGTRSVPLPAGRGPLVSGQGLDRLVRARLDELARGETLVVSYAIPSRLEAYEFRVRAAEPAGGGATVRVRVEFSSFLLRLLAPSLEVEYDRETRRLLRYRGLSNLSDSAGENPDVLITYAYPEAAREEEPRGAP